MPTEGIAMAIEFAEIWVCECCAIVAANGDDSGCRDFWNHEDHALSKVDGHVIVASSEEDDYRNEFSWSSCDGCGDSLGGGRIKGYIEITSEVAPTSV